jgi:hypothetical protein
MEKIISSAEGDKLMLAIVDDITVCSKTSAIVEVISSVNPSPPPEVGRFFLNVSKTISFPTCLAGPSLIPDPTPSGMPEGVVCMKRGPPEKNGVRLLGSPIGSSEFKAQWIHDRIDSKLLPLLKQIENNPTSASTSFAVLSLSSALFTLPEQLTLALSSLSLRELMSSFSMLLPNLFFARIFPLPRRS